LVGKVYVEKPLLRIFWLGQKGDILTADKKAKTT
jgi:hypothetical protein